MRIMLIILVAALLLSCGNDDSNGDLFSISVVDINGHAVPGLDVSVINGCFNDPHPMRPQTTIHLLVSEASDVKIDIFDLKEHLIRNLHDGFLEDGSYSYNWDGKDFSGNQANIGGTNIFRYEATFRAHDTNEITSQQSKYMCMWLNTGNSQSNIGTTNVNGRFAFNNMLAFPHLFHTGSQPYYDADANYYGTFTLSNSINIKLIDPMTGEYIFYTKLMESDESNHYKLIWSNPQIERTSVNSNFPDSYNINRQDMASNIQTDRHSRKLSRDPDGSGGGTANDVETTFLLTPITLPEIGEIAGNVIVVPPDDGDGPGYEINFQIYDEIQNGYWYYADYSYVIIINGNLQIDDIFMFSLPYTGVMQSLLALYNGLEWSSYYNGQWDIPETGSVTLPLTVASITDSSTTFEVGFLKSTGPSVILSSFTAVCMDGTPVLQWETQSEYNNAGWNVRRSEEEDFSNSMIINSEPIPGAGTTSQPTNYTFLDESEVEEGNTYYYWLESNDSSGNDENYGPISITIDGFTPHPTFQNYPNPFY